MLKKLQNTNECLDVTCTLCMDQDRNEYRKKNFLVAGYELHVRF